MGPQLYIGLMSGTSLDGVDAVLADFGAAKQLLAAHHQPFTADLRAALWALLQPGGDELARAAKVAIELSRCYAAGVGALLRAANVDASLVRAIGCHGQTVRHCPEAGYSIQLVNGALLAELTGDQLIPDLRESGRGLLVVGALSGHTAEVEQEQNRTVIRLRLDGCRCGDHR